MSLRYDLHTHSWASDGTLSPADLVRRARRSGVDVVALTDHDDTAGIEEASRAAAEEGIGLVAGVEVSVTWRGGTIHLIGLHLDPAEGRLQAGLAQLREFREWRAGEIARRLQPHGVHDALDGARKFARGRIVSRTHFALYLVERGYGRDVRTVFKHFLRRNKPGHVPGKWATLEEAVAWIIGAGGQAVIAHPARYEMTATKLRHLIGEFKECGGVGIEVISGSHSREESLHVGKLAERHALLASSGSDYHGPENPWIDLGRLPELPAACTPIWSSWECVAAAGRPQSHHPSSPRPQLTELQ